MLTRANMACAAFLLGAPAYVACFLRHICMCGHLAHVDGPDRAWELAGDAGWLVLLTLAAALGLLSGVWRTRGVGAVSVVLLGTRCLLSSAGGFCGIFPELPGLLAGAGLAVLHLTGRGRSRIDSALESE